MAETAMTHAEKVRLLQMMIRADPDGTGNPLRQRLVDELSAESERAEAGQVAERLAAIERLLAQQVKGPEPPPERRRDMSPKRKSDLISELGIERYNALPW